MCVWSVTFSLFWSDADLEELSAYVLLRVDSLEHEQSLPQIPPTLLRNPLVERCNLTPAFLLAHGPQNPTDLVLCRGCNPDKQRSATNRCDDVACGVRQEDQAKVGTVLLHGPSERRLRISRQVVCLIDDDDLEALLCAQVDLLGLRHFFEQILHHHSVVVADIRRCDLEVVYGCDDVEFELAVRGCLEDTGVDLDLLDTRAVEFFERCYDTRLLACTRRSIDQKMREVTALCLDCCVSSRKVRMRQKHSQEL
jgi:hypothetical protein